MANPVLSDPASAGPGRRPVSCSIRRFIKTGGSIAALLAGMAVAGVGTGLGAEAPAVDFARDIFPVLEARCFECHGPAKQKAGLRLDGKTAAMSGGKSGAAIKPGDSAGSPLAKRIASTDTDEVMPPKGERLTPAQVAAVRAWIDAGAVWPAGVGATVAEVKPHWAYAAPRHADPPAVRHRAWPRNPIDRDRKSVV